MIQQPNAVLRFFVGPEIICRFDNCFALQISFKPNHTVLGMRQSLIQTSPVRRAINELLGKQILMHIQNDIHAVFFGQLHNAFDLVQVFVIDFARLWLHSIPEDAVAQQIKAHAAEVRESLFNFGVDMTCLPAAAQHVHTMQDHLFSTFGNKRQIL